MPTHFSPVLQVHQHLKDNWIESCFTAFIFYTQFVNSLNGAKCCFVHLLSTIVEKGKLLCDMVLLCLIAVMKFTSTIGITIVNARITVLLLADVFEQENQMWFLSS